jgi:hypothetical protein
MTDTVKRFGMTVNARGTERPFGLMPEFSTPYEPTSYVGRYRGENTKAKRIGQRLHELNTAQILAEKRGNASTLPDKETRLRLARADAKALQESARAAQSIDDGAYGMRLGLKPFDYSKATPHDRWMMEQRLATLKAQPDDKARLALINGNRDFRMAAFAAGENDGDHLLSGFTSDLSYKMAYENQLHAAWPDHMRTTADTGEAAKAYQQTLKTVNEALENEFRALGASMDEPKPAAPAPVWE